MKYHAFDPKGETRHDSAIRNTGHGMNRRSFLNKFACGGAVLATPFFIKTASAVDPMTMQAAERAAIALLDSPEIKQQLDVTLGLVKNVCDLGSRALKQVTQSLLPNNFIIRDKKWVSEAPTPEERLHREYAAKAVPANGPALQEPLKSKRFPVVFAYSMLPLLVPATIASAALGVIGNLAGEATKILPKSNSGTVDPTNRDLNMGETLAIDEVRRKMKTVATATGLREAMGPAQMESLQKNVFANDAMPKSQRESLSKSWTCLYRRLMLDPLYSQPLFGFLFQEKETDTKPFAPAEIDPARPYKQWYIMVPDSSSNKAGHAYRDDMFRVIDAGPPTLIV